MVNVTFPLIEELDLSNNKFNLLNMLNEPRLKSLDVSRN